MSPTFRTQIALGISVLVILFTIGFALQPTYTVVSEFKVNFSTTKGTFSDLRIGSDAVYFRGYVYDPSKEVIGFKNFDLTTPKGHLLLEGTRFTAEERKVIDTFSGQRHFLDSGANVQEINKSNPLWLFNPLANYFALFVLAWIVLLTSTAAFIFSNAKPLDLRFVAALAATLAVALFLSLSRPAVFGDEAFILTDYTTALAHPTPALLDASGHADLFFYPLYAPFFALFGPFNGLRIAAALFMMLAAVSIFFLLARVAGEKTKTHIALLSSLPLIVVFASDPVGQSGLALLFSSLFFIALSNAEKEQESLLFAGIFAGAAARTYPIMMVLPVFYVLAVVLFFRQKRNFSHFALSLGIIGLFLLPVAAFHLTHDPFLSQGYVASKSPILFSAKTFISQPSLNGLVGMAVSYAGSFFGALAGLIRTFAASSTNVPQLFSIMAAAGIACLLLELRKVWKKIRTWIAALVFGFMPLTFMRPENTLSLSLLLLVIPVIVLAASGVATIKSRTLVAVLFAASILQIALLLPALYRPADFSSSQVTDWVKSEYLERQSGTVFLSNGWDKSFFFHLRENPRIITVDDYYYTLYPRIQTGELSAAANTGDLYVSTGPIMLNRTKVIKTIGNAIIYAFV